MVAGRWEADAAEEAVLADSAAAGKRLHKPIAQRFGRGEVRRRVRRYLVDLLQRAADYRRARAGRGPPARTGPP